MNDQRFDNLTLRLVEAPMPRRDSLRLIAGAVLTGLVTGAGFGPQAAEAATCKHVNQRCRRARQCCSGICRGKRGKKTCRGHGAGTCKRGQSFCTAPDPDITLCNNRPDCQCIVTTSGTSFCFNGGAFSGSNCAACARDADCVKRGFPRGSACAVVSAGRCAGICSSGRACVVRCDAAPPP